MSSHSGCFAIAGSGEGGAVASTLCFAAMCPQRVQVLNKQAMHLPDAAASFFLGPRSLNLSGIVSTQFFN